MLDATHSDIAVRLDFVDPEALLHQGAGSAQQLLQLAQSERPHLHKAAQSRHQQQTQTHHGRSLIRQGVSVDQAPHQVADVDDAGHFAPGRRRLPGCADRVVDGDGNACFLLADGATHQGVAGGHWKEGGG